MFVITKRSVLDSLVNSALIETCGLRLITPVSTMKTFLKIIATFTLFTLSLVAAEPDEQKAKVLEISTSFWKAMTEEKADEAKKSLFTKADDPELEGAEFFEKMAVDEFNELLTHLKESKEVAKVKEITVLEIKEKRGREIAHVTLMVWEPKEKEFEKMSIALMKTKKSGWKIVDL